MFFVVLPLCFLGGNAVAQGESLSLSVTFDETDSLLNSLKLISKNDYVKTAGANNRGVQLKSTRPIDLSGFSNANTDFSLLLWFQLDKDTRSKQTLFFAQDSLSFFTVFIKNGALTVQYTDVEDKLVAHYKFLPSLSVDHWQMLGVSFNQCKLSVSVGCEMLLDEPLNTSLFERKIGQKDIFIGSDNINSAFKGKLDELTLFKKPLTPIQFRWFCSKNFLDSYLPIKNGAQDTPTEPQTGLNNIVSSFSNNAVIGNKPEEIRPKEFVENTVTVGKTYPMSLSHFTFQVDVFIEKLTYQELITLSSEDESHSVSMFQKQDSLQITYEENGTRQSTTVYAGIKELQQNQLTLEFECCNIKVYNNCTLQAEKRANTLIKSRGSNNYKLGVTEKVTIKKTHYLPFINYDDSVKSSFICQDRVENFNTAKDSSQIAIKGLFDTRKSYIKKEPIEVKTKQVLLSFWDFDRIDGDTVSAIFNEELILEYHGLTYEKVTKMVELEDSKENILKLYAHSDGSEGNNTVKVGILSGGGYYQEVDISTEVLLNGGIKLIYKPDE